MDYFLARLPAFRRLPEEVLARLSAAFPIRKHGKGEAFFREGEPPHSVFLLRSGLVKAVKYSPSDEPVIMQLIVPGMLFGMIAVLDAKSYPVSALCLHESEAYRIPTPDFQELLAKHPDFSREVFSQVGQHVRHSQALRSLSQEPVERRIMYILWVLSESIGRELPVLREDIAEMAGTTQETAIRTLAALRRKKLISSRWKSITVLEASKLKALSEPR
ncbi:MAG: Crp/Fnr family transcriptional regulator [Elusimicrobia bacterium]|nr:Crp/Fnr family transcriptional regulator [Elusimicrobiota bacterium]